jgi:23S rRNA (cytidine1920-2'-O)/16S rRNA (cytidine1409-2'-O)-methyltransferase
VTVVTRRRLDAELVRRGYARSRQQASELIEQGRVVVRGVPAGKPATVVDPDTPVIVTAGDERAWASRGAHKLIGALDAFGTEVTGLRCLDAGASTGGFTDVLLARGAAQVVAVDVGYGQLVWRLRSDARVQVHDRTNVRALEPDAIGGPADLVVADLSFISLRTVLPALEVGRQRLGAGGVVRDATLRLAALTEVTAAARSLGLVLRGAVASPLPGPSGNVEYFLRLSRHGEDAGDLVLARAIEEGP